MKNYYKTHPEKYELHKFYVCQKRYQKRFIQIIENMESLIYVYFGKTGLNGNDTPERIFPNTHNQSTTAEK
jgi:hypothetical protein